MEEKCKLVSVIIPTYSRPNNLCRAIESVLDQTYSPIEIIVVDDNGAGSQYQVETESILSEYISSGKIQYVTHQTNRNGSAARNTGFKYSKGAYINFLDDDDILMPTKIQEQVMTLESKDSYDACYCNMLVHGKKRDFISSYNKEGNLCYDLLAGKTSFNTSSLLFRRQAIEDINGWDESFNRHQDVELMVRFYRNHLVCRAEKSDYLLEKFATPNIVSKNPRRAVEFRMHLLNKMQTDIEQQSSPRNIYRYQYESLCLTLISNKETILGLKYFFTIMKYGSPSLTCSLKVLYYSITNVFK